MPPAHQSLLLMPCGGLKLPHAARADEIYTGPMWTTLRTQRRAMPRLAILSAKHGFIGPADKVAPYDQRMTEERAAELLGDLGGLAEAVARAAGTGVIHRVFMVGGKTYRQVMEPVVSALVARGLVARDAEVRSTQGPIGVQRSQLGAFLRSIPAAK